MRRVSRGTGPRTSCTFIIPYLSTVVNGCMLVMTRTAYGDPWAACQAGYKKMALTNQLRKRKSNQGPCSPHMESLLSLAGTDELWDARIEPRVVTRG